MNWDEVMENLVKAVEQYVEAIAEFRNEAEQKETTSSVSADALPPSSRAQRLRAGSHRALPIPEPLPPVAGEGFWKIPISAAMREHTAVTGQ